MMHLPWLWKIGDASVWTHENVGRMQCALQETTSRFAQMNTSLKYEIENATV